jgi:adenosylhomocysteine nucleosidase
VTQHPDPQRFLVAMALPIEEQDALTAVGIDVVFTGVGKVNAAASLARRLTQRRLAGTLPSLVVNFGTVGSRRFDTGTLVACHRFVQRDMDVSPLGFERGHTPYDEYAAELSFPTVFTQLPAAVCGTGDSFETGPTALACDVIDMEAYALAKVCLLEDLPFACAKFVTDGESCCSGRLAEEPAARRGRFSCSL